MFTLVNHNNGETFEFATLKAATDNASLYNVNGRAGGFPDHWSVLNDAGECVASSDPDRVVHQTIVKAATDGIVKSSANL